MVKTQKKIIIAFVCLLIFNLSSLSYASYLQLMSNDAKAMSLADSVTANPPDYMSIHYNPAGLTNLRNGYGISQNFNISLLKKKISIRADNNYEIIKSYNAKMDPVSNTTLQAKKIHMYLPFLDSVDMPLNIVPLPFCMSYRPENSDWVFANAVYMPFANGYSFEASNDTKFSFKSFFNQHFVYMSPSFGYFINNDLSVGFSIGLGQSSMGYETDIRLLDEKIGLTNILPLGHSGISPFETIAEMEFELRNDFVPSLNFGIIWEPLNWLSFGLVYRNSLKSSIKGNLSINYSNNFYNFCNWLKNNPEAVSKLGINELTLINNNSENHVTKIENFKFPQTIDIGVKLSLLNNLKLLADIHWFNYSEIKDYKINILNPNAPVFHLFKEFSNDNKYLLLKNNYNNTINYSFGLEYQIKEFMTLRFGYEKKNSNINKDSFFIYSEPDIKYFSAGIGLKLKKRMKLDIGMAYFNSHEILIPHNTSQNINFKNGSKITNSYIGQDISSKINGFHLSFNISCPLKYK